MTTATPVQHRSLAPVLLVGHGSSGTSILSRLLRDYFKISFGTESQFIVRFHKRLSMYGDLTDDANYERLVDHLLTERWFERCHNKWGFNADRQSLLDLQDRSFTSLVNAVFLQLAAQNEMPPRWGDKTPYYLFHLDLLDEMFQMLR